MNKQTRAVFFVLIILLVILAASTSFFAAKTYKMSDAPKEVKKSSDSETVSKTAAQAMPSASSEVRKPAAITEKPSHPADTYTVQRGETLFVVAQNVGSNWQDISEANGLTDADKIQAGKVLIIPKAGQVNFTLDSTLAATIQNDADEGTYPFRLDPVETARSDAPTSYGIKISDNFALKNKSEGSAQVQVSIEGKNYLIKLNQPVTRGDKGIWAIESIRPV